MRREGQRRALFCCAALVQAMFLAGCVTPPEEADLVQAAPVVAEAPAPDEGTLAAPSTEEIGRASYYAPHFNGRRMANGRRFDPRAATVAHRSLPFGTTVRVTHLGNGRSVMATVQDRGPFVPGRILDVSPAVARDLGMLREGVAQVEMVPVEVAEARD